MYIYIYIYIYVYTHKEYGVPARGRRASVGATQLEPTPSNTYI